jgi:hypothetical protein
LRSNLDQAVRRQILAAIGIDRWVLRTGASAVAADAVSPQPAERSPVGAAPASQPAAASDAVGAISRSRSGDRSHEESVRATVRPGEAAAAAGSPGRSNEPSEPVDAPFSVLSLSTDGVTLLLERTPSGRESRLARDLLAAASGRWDVQPARREFDWPPAVAIPGVSGPGAGDRALRAFVEKELADHGCTLVMVGDGLAARLGTLRHAAERVLLPDLAILGRDSAEKRRIWSELGRHRLLGRRVSGAPAGPESDAP